VHIDYDSGEPVYLQIARLLRDQIIQGELQVGAQLPSGNEMQASRGVTRVTYQHAVDQLREAGLVVTRAGKGTFVVAVPMLQVISLQAGDQVTARMPTEAEREQLDTGLTPVLVVTRADGAEEVFPAAVTVCQAQPAPAAPSSPPAAASPPAPAQPRAETQPPADTPPRADAQPPAAPPPPADTRPPADPSPLAAASPADADVPPPANAATA
jgi:DNA-binding transcriptional regulator YhcF (GntR family)